MGANKSISDPPDATTVIGSGPAPSIFDRPGPPHPALTILWHPDIRRVGDWYVFSSFASKKPKPLELSRTKPGFGQTAKRPLGDPGVSRKPLRFSPLAGGGLRIEPGRWPAGALEINFRSVTSALDVGPEQLERGLVLNLSHRIVLLLHLRHLGLPDDLETALVGVSAPIERVRNSIERAAPTEDPVLIRGETGTGKELVAGALFAHSRRATKPFLTVNLGAIPSHQASTELFGSEKGAYTGVQARKGYFRQAHGGTLFLDEIGEIDTETQVALLRAVELGEIQPAGSRGPTEVDVRILAATDANLEDSDFRPPLLHRLSAHVIEIPPLRERRDDIGCLFLHFLQKELGSSFGPLLKEPREKAWIHPSIPARLAAYDWPGNVRELQNVVRQLVAASRTHRGFTDFMRVPARLEELLFQDFPADQERKLPEREQRPASELSREEVLACLEQAEWTPAKASHRLGISHQALDRLMRKFRIKRAADLERSEIQEIARAAENVQEAAARLHVSERALLIRIKQLGLALTFRSDEGNQTGAP